jgi:hypothetical protein
VLVTAANVGGNNFEEDTVFALAISEGQLREINAMDLDDAGSHIGYSAIAWHEMYPPVLRDACSTTTENHTRAVERAPIEAPDLLESAIGSAVDSMALYV